MLRQGIQEGNPLLTWNAESHSTGCWWWLVLLSHAGSLRDMCVLKGWERARELAAEAERTILSLPALLTCSFCALQDRGLPGKLEPVSPVSPAHPEAELDLLPARLSKEELIQNMDRVDREITMVEQQISKLKKKQVGGWALRGSSCLCFCSLADALSLPMYAHRGEMAVPLPPGWAAAMFLSRRGARLLC